jgi:hypothetical protein
MPKGIPGYPSNKQLQAQALALARAGVPTKKSINRQYGRGIQDTEAFTQALLANLGSISSGIGGAYSQAVGDQQSIDAAARARLSALGGEYGAGSAAAVGGMGDSALSHLVANRAAAQNYGAQLPAAAAARGQLGVHSLETARSDALRQRGEDLRSQYIQTLNQVQNQALARSQLLSSNRNAALDRQLQQQSMAQNQAQFETTQAETKREFDKQFGLSKAQFQATLASTGGGGTAGSLNSSIAALAAATGLTNNEVNTQMAKALGLVQGTAPEKTKVPVYDKNGHIKGYNLQTIGGSGTGGPVDYGVPFPKAVQAIINESGVPRPIALAAAARIYKQARRQKGKGPTYAYYSFVQWMAAHGFKPYTRLVKQSSFMPPSGPFGGPH